MNILMIIPNVVKRYVASFPEATNNAYNYFNYDHRVVDERVFRGDAPSSYKGPNQFNDMEYDSLVAFAQQYMDSRLARYSATVACEDALNLAIKTFNKGAFDGKVNANKFEVLIAAMKEKYGGRQAKKVKPAPEKDKEVGTAVLKQLGIKRKDIPQGQTQRVPKGLTHLVREKGKILVRK